MKFKPFNRYVLIEKHETGLLTSEKQNSTILVPDSYVPESQYGVYKVLMAAPDCERVGAEVAGKIILANTSMVEKVEIPGHTFSMVLENYIYGVFCDEQNN